MAGPVEADPEYRLIVAANNLTVEIDNELSEFFLFYLMRFTTNPQNLVLF